MQLAFAFLLVLGCVASVFAGPKYAQVVYYPNPRPDPLTDCCIQGVPICARLSEVLAIKDLGCEISCRSSGHPGSMGCNHDREVPSCGCYIDDGSGTGVGVEIA